MGKEEPAGSTTATIEKSTKNPAEIAASIKSIDFESAPGNQIAALDELRNSGELSLYKSATMEAGSGDLRSYPVSQSMLEQRSGLTGETLGVGKEEVTLDDLKFATLWVVGGSSVAGVASLALLPENIGATVCYFVALFPILFLGVGSTAPQLIANVIAGFKGEKDTVNRVDRVCRHEAAHFLCGYLCGLPIASYATADEDIPRVEFHDTAEGPLTAKRELTEDEVNTLAVVAMSGSVAEVMEFGQADGTSGDLIGLQNVFRRSAEFIGSEKQQDLTRWGALTAYRLLNANKDKLDKLVFAFAAQKSIAECIAEIEQ